MAITVSPARSSLSQAAGVAGVGDKAEVGRKGMYDTIVQSMVMLVHTSARGTLFLDTRLAIDRMALNSAT